MLGAGGESSPSADARPKLAAPPGGVPPELADWVESVAGPIRRAQPLAGGNRRLGWRLDLQTSDGVHPAYLRFDPTDPAVTGDVYTLAREAVVCAALTDTAVHAPPIVATHPTLQAVLAGWAAGQADFHGVTDPDVREALASDFIAQVATLHRLDPRDLTLPGFPAPQALAVHVEDELRTWDGLYRHTGRPEPLIEFALSWLRRNMIEAAGPVVLVHGDAGPGNFLFDDSHVTAVIDWELAHIGDPMEDLAWLSLRTAQETFPDFARRLAEYERLSGIDVDANRLRYHLVFAELRVVIIRHRAVGEINPNGDVGNGLLSAGLHRRLLVEALADVKGVELVPPPLPPSLPTERDWLLEGALAQLRQIATAETADAIMTRRAKGVARVVKHLQQIDRLGARLDADDLADVEALLGQSFRTPVEGRTVLAEQLRTNDGDSEESLVYLGRAVARETELLRPALGALADRHHPALHWVNADTGAS